VPTHATGVVCTRRSPFESTNAGWLLRRLGRPAVAQELVPDHQRHARLGEGLTRGVAHVRALFAKKSGVYSMIIFTMSYAHWKRSSALETRIAKLADLRAPRLPLFALS